MAHNIDNTLIYAPIQMPADFSAVLNYSYTGLQALCQSSRINMWAKFKPIHRASVGVMTDQQRRDLNYGIVNIPTWSNILKMRNFWMGIDMDPTNNPDCGRPTEYWDYNKPSSYFRLSDFSGEAQTDAVGYKHDAQAPIGALTNTTVSLTSSGTLRINYNSGVPDSKSVGLDDLQYPSVTSLKMKNMYFGVMLYNTSTGITYAGTQYSGGVPVTADDLPTYGAWIDISGLSSSFAGTYYCFPFLSDVAIPFTSSLSGYGNYHFVALYERQTLIINTATAGVLDLGFISAKRSSSGRETITCIVDITNRCVSPGGTCSLQFDFYNSGGTNLGTYTRTTGYIYYNDALTYTAAIDVQGDFSQANAYEVRCIATMTAGGDTFTDTAWCYVTNSSTVQNTYQIYLGGDLNINVGDATVSNGVVTASKYFTASMVYELSRIAVDVYDGNGNYLYYGSSDIDYADPTWIVSGASTRTFECSKLTNNSTINSLLGNEGYRLVYTFVYLEY